MTTQHNDFPHYENVSNEDIVVFGNKKWMFFETGVDGSGWYSTFDGRLPDATLTSIDFDPTKPIRTTEKPDQSSGVRTVDHFIDLNTIDEIPDTPQP